MNPQQQPGGPVPPQPEVPPQPPVQPATPVVSGGHGPEYDFIMNPGKPVKKPPIISGSSLTERIAIAGAAGVVLIILIIIVAALISSGSKAGKNDLVRVAAEQTELVRIATAGGQSASSLATKSLAQNTMLSVSSQKTQLLLYMKANGQKLSADELTSRRSTANDTSLATAKANDTYDETFTSIIQADLASYQQALQKAYKDKPGPKGNALLKADFNAAALLQTQSKQK